MTDKNIDRVTDWFRNLPSMIRPSELSEADRERFAILVNKMSMICGDDLPSTSVQVFYPARWIDVEVTPTNKVERQQQKD